MVSADDPLAEMLLLEEQYRQDEAAECCEPLGLPSEDEAADVLPGYASLSVSTEEGSQGGEEQERRGAGDAVGAASEGRKLLQSSMRTLYVWGLLSGPAFAAELGGLAPVGQVCGLACVCAPQLHCCLVAGAWLRSWRA